MPLALCGLITVVIVVVLWQGLTLWNEAFDTSPWVVYALSALASAAAALLLPRHRPRRATRVAILGSQASAVALEQEFEINPVRGYVFAGWIALEGAPAFEFPQPRPLGSLCGLAALVVRHEIDLVVVGPNVPRLEVFDELLTLASTQGVCACELTSFYEDAFGHIPIEQINSAWFQHLMHPRFRSAESSVKRAFDMVFSASIGFASLPLLAVSAALIKADRGPVLYREVRIGEGGRPFTIYRLRTMSTAREPEAQQSCSADDHRVTRVGRVLRRLHVDEMPQLYNVLRGEMSLVGPRPGQPELAGGLESRLAFYSRRQLVKPGLTGWAQIRCGYTRSESGSAWSLCHDLYYLKHQSLAFDCMILLRTIGALASTTRAAAPDDARSTRPPAERPPLDKAAYAQTAKES